MGDLEEDACVALLTPHKLIGSKKELLALLKKVDPTGFALHNIAFT